MILNFLYFFLILNFVADSYGQRSKKFFRKDYTYINAVEAFYKVYPVPYSWIEAKRVCAWEGATFWHPDNKKELDAVTTFWKEDKPLITFLWTALSDILVEGQFETIDGKPSSQVYINWVENNPNNLNDDEDCAHLETSGVMTDWQCDFKSHFICKKSLQSLEWDYHCDMPNLDYTFNKNTGKCYKLHTTPLNWTDANAMCQLEQSTLAVINNRQEANYLVQLTKSTPISRPKEKYQRGIYHVGIHNRLKEGWQNIKGSPLNIDPEAWFEGFQPGVDYEECGSMFFDGHLINTDCNMKSFFICEHGLDNVAPVTDTLADLEPYVGGGIE